MSAQPIAADRLARYRRYSVPRANADAELGMAWWNALSVQQRMAALTAASTCVPAEAWERWKLKQSIGRG